MLLRFASFLLLIVLGLANPALAQSRLDVGAMPALEPLDLP